MIKTSKIYIAGSNGMVGSAIVRKLKATGFNNLITPSSKELDLRNQDAVNTFFGRFFPSSAWFLQAVDKIFR